MSGPLPAKVTRWLRRAAGMDTHALAHLCLWLALDADADGCVEVAPGEFAAGHGLVYRHVRRQLDALTAGGWLSLERKASRSRGALYSLTTPTVTGDAERQVSTLTPDAQWSASGTRERHVSAQRAPAGRPETPGMPADTCPSASGVGPPPIGRALPDHTATARAVRSSSEADPLSLAVNGRAPNGARTRPERETNGHAPPQPPALTLVDLVRAAQPDMTGDEAAAVIAATRAAGRVDSLTGWAGSARGQVDIRERLAAHRQATRTTVTIPAGPCPDGCVGGWLGDPDRPAPCPTHKPHRANGHHG